MHPLKQLNDVEQGNSCSKTCPSSGETMEKRTDRELKTKTGAGERSFPSGWFFRFNSEKAEPYDSLKLMGD